MLIPAKARKYRDEARPRQGLLRGREFVMKDLYTFDYNTEDALVTYNTVREAYKRIFDALKVPYLVAAADSGNMGGNLSHEFHLLSAKGEDTLVSCSGCDYVYNEEVSDGHDLTRNKPSRLDQAEPSNTGVGAQEPPAIATELWTAVSHDKTTLVRAWYPKYSVQRNFESGQKESNSDLGTDPVEREINSHAVKALAKAAGIDLNTSVKNAAHVWFQDVTSDIPSDSPTKHAILDLFDSHVVSYNHPPLSGLPETSEPFKHPVQFSKLDSFPGTSDGLDLTRTVDGDKCPKCTEGVLRTHNAIEMGHTFHLGTRYSEILGASVPVDPSRTENNSQSEKEVRVVPMQMGCHGIGVSRMISAVADTRADTQGLNWPRAIAPYEIIIIPTKGLDSEAEQIYDLLKSTTDTGDVILDDRAKQVGWKLKDADLIGFPIVIVVGKAWKTNQEVEVQCRQLDGLRENVNIATLGGYLQSLLQKL
jgi:prolyl-tRNA synthetase